MFIGSESDGNQDNTLIDVAERDREASVDNFGLLASAEYSRVAVEYVYFRR